MNKKKNDFFLIAPLPFWGCVSIWLSNLARLTPESAVPYAWAALFFSYGIVALYGFTEKRLPILAESQKTEFKRCFMGLH